MRKIMLLVLTLCVSLCACSKEGNAEVSDISTATEVQNESINNVIDDVLPEAVIASTESTGPEYEVGQIGVSPWKGNNNYWLGISIEIKNTGTSNMLLRNSFCDVEDQNGNLIAAQQQLLAFPSVLAPGETGYLSANLMSDYTFGENPVIVPRVIVEETEEEAIRYNVSDVKLICNDLCQEAI